MKVFAVNSSARTGADSKTQIMLEALIEGMAGAGAKVEVINLVGCFSCWTRTPGKCIHKDDMSEDVPLKSTILTYTFHNVPTRANTPWLFSTTPTPISSWTRTAWGFRGRVTPFPTTPKGPSDHPRSKKHPSKWNAARKLR